MQGSTTAVAYKKAAIGYGVSGMVSQNALKEGQRHMQRFLVECDERENIDVMAEILETMEYLTYECEIGSAEIQDRMKQIAQTR
jgi:hypothetical protein